MRKNSYFLSLLLAVILITLLTGCGNAIRKPDTSSKVDRDIDGKVVVATVNGVDILKSQFLEVYYGKLQYFSEMGKDVDENTEGGKANIEIIKKDAMDYIIKIELMRQEAEKGGFSKLTDEEKEALSKELDEYIKEGLDAKIEEVKKANPKKTDDEIKKIAEEEYWDSVNYSREQAIDDLYRNKGIGKYQEYILKDVKADESKVLEEYNKLVEQQKKDFTADINKYEEAFDDEETTVVYNLPGYKRVQSLLIKNSDEDIDAIRDLASADPVDTEALNAKKAGALKKIEQKAKDIQNKVLAKNSDFASLISQYGEDPGMADEETRNKGYLVGNGTTSLISEFVNASVALKEIGDLSGLVGSEYGYFIIKLIEKLPEGEVALEKVHDKIAEPFLTEAKDALWTKTLEDLIKKSDIVRHEDRLIIHDYK